MAKTYTFSSNGITDFLEDYYQSAWLQSGDEHKARGVCHALIRYVNTNRAPIEFEKSMLRSDPAMLARVSLLGGSDEQILTRIMSYLKHNHASA